MIRRVLFTKVYLALLPPCPSLLYSNSFSTRPYYIFHIPALPLLPTASRSSSVMSSPREPSHSLPSVSQASPFPLPPPPPVQTTPEPKLIPSIISQTSHLQTDHNNMPPSPPDPHNHIVFVPRSWGQTIPTATAIPSRDAALGHTPHLSSNINADNVMLQRWLTQGSNAEPFNHIDSVVRPIACASPPEEGKPYIFPYLLVPESRCASGLLLFRD